MYGGLTWSELFFSGWTNLLPLIPIAIVVGVVLALPSLIVRQRSERAYRIAWAVSTAVALIFVVAWVIFNLGSSVSRIAMTPVLGLAFLAPQLLAYPLARRNRALVPVAASGLAVLGLSVWMTAGALLGVGG